MLQFDAKMLKVRPINIQDAILVRQHQLILDCMANDDRNFRYAVGLIYQDSVKAEMFSGIGAVNSYWDTNNKTIKTTNIAEDAMREATTERQLEFSLGQERLAEIAKEIGDLLNQVKNLEDALAAAKENAKGISKLMQTVRELGVLVERGSEMRPVVCQWTYDMESGLKFLTRTDTGEKLEDTACEMTDAEKQGDLFVGESGTLGDGTPPPPPGGGDTDPMDDPTLRIPENPKE